MGLEYIRDYYKVPAHKGVRVVAYGKPGVITGASGPHVMIKLDGAKFAQPYHPTDDIEYLPIAERAKSQSGENHG